MSKEIKVSQTAVEANVKAISGAAGYFEAVALTPVDNRTTITANAKAQKTFAKSQSVKKSFGDSMRQEANHIKGLGIIFQQYDKIFAEVWENEVGEK